MTPGIVTFYIARRFMLAIIGMFSLFLLLIFMIDFVEILRISTKHSNVSFFTLLSLTLLRLPSFAEMSLPFAVLAGSIVSFLLLSKTSELTVIRACGISVWQFVLPGVVVALIVGLLATLVYNPLAASAKEQSDELYADIFGKESSIFTSKSGAWLRQNGTDGPSVMSAQAVTNKGTLLTSVTIFRFDKQEHFSERLEAKSAELKDGRWDLKNVWISSTQKEPVFHESYSLSTYLTPTQVMDAMGSADSISFWKLPSFIASSELAKLPATQFKVQYQLLLSRPLLLISMVLLAATCSLKGFRFGNIQTMVIGGLSAGFVYFMGAEVSRNLGLSGLTAASIAAWAPVFMACCITITVLLYQEDG